MKNWLVKLRAGRLILATVVISVLLAETIVTALSLWMHDEIRSDYLITGFITTVIVSFIVVVIIQSIVRALQRTDEQLLERTLYLDSILQSTGDTMIIALDTTFRVKYLNAMAERVLDTSVDKAHGQRITDLVNGVRREHFEQAMRAVSPGRGHSFQFNYELDKSTHYFEATLSEIQHRGHLAGFLLVAHDATDSKMLEETLRNLSYQDGLTGIANRRRFDEKLEQEWRRTTREHQPISLVMIDIDFFKNYNDLYGHPAGDECLKKIAYVLMESVSRPGDIAARYGGEEFAVILPNTSPPGARKLAEQIRAQVEAMELPHANSVTSPWVTVSAGVATRIPTSDEDFTTLLEGADRALYLAKQQGRNRVIVDSH